MSEHPLTAWRTAQGLTRVQLAARLGVSDAQISRIESGKRNPSIRLMRRIVLLTAGAVTANDLVGREAA